MLLFATALLHAAIAAACPIDGVAIGDPNDVSTWRIDFAVGATKQQQTNAQALLVKITPAALASADGSVQAAVVVQPDPLAQAKAAAIASLATASVG